MLVPTQFTTTRDGVTIAYCSEGAGPPLVFTRGWITHVELLRADPRFAAFFAPLKEHFRVTWFDNRGNGLSDRAVTDVDLDDLVLDLEAVVDAVGAEDMVLWGSCFGGPIAAVYTQRHPHTVSRLVLDGTFARGAEMSTPEGRASFLALFDTADAVPDAAFAALSYLTGPDTVQAHAPRAKNSISPAVARTLYTLAYDIDVSDVMAALDVPTLVLHRRNTRAVGARLGRKVAALIPGANFVSLEGTSHNLWDEDPDSALAAVGEFLGVDLRVDKQEAAPDLPIAVVFTDLVDSTATIERLGDARARQVMGEHDRIIRTECARAGGTEVKSTGDGFLLSFPSVARALSWAVRVQSALGEYNREAPVPVHVRVGINAGEPMSADDDLHGAAVNMAARVCAKAAGGQVLVTNVVRELATGKGFVFTDAGTAELKGFAAPVQLYELKP
jgi:class 3 adenylate cyclase